MFDIEQKVTQGIEWLGQTWERLTKSTAKGLREAWRVEQANLKSHWSAPATRLFFSQPGVALARMLGKTAPPIEREKPDTLQLYTPTGELHTRQLTERSTSWNQSPNWHGPWSTPSFWVTFSQAGQLAGGALASEHAKPGELDRFVEQIRIGRRVGLYQAEVFQQARALLRQPDPTNNEPKLNPKEVMTSGAILIG